ncbi:MAG: hypothetical protein ACRELG_11315 [Gemmataceae bacterium]
MLLRHWPRSRVSFSAAHRSGKATLALLLALPAMLLAMAMAFYAAELVETRTLLRNATDAAALAGVQTFVNDDLLRGNPQTMSTLIPRAILHAQEYAGLNLVFGNSLYLDPTITNDQNADIVFGTLAYPRSTNFILPDLSNLTQQGQQQGQQAKPEWLTINTVRVTGQCNGQRPNGPVYLHNGPLLSQMPNNAVAVSTATLDRFVIGFRPMGRQPMPLCPLALFSHRPGNMKHCWEYNVEKRRGRDMHKVRRNGPYHQILNGPDGLHEMDVFLGTGQGTRQNLNAQLMQGKFNCCKLHFGSSLIKDLVWQIVNGVGRVHLSQYGGQLVLGPGNLLEVNGTPYGPSANSSDGQTLQNALQQLQSIGIPLLWPCFSSFDKGTNNPVLCGFVAARVVRVNGSSGKAKGVTFSVQPCMMATGTAVTDVARVGVGIAKLPNPYICKVRLVE